MGKLIKKEEVPRNYVRGVDFNLDRAEISLSLTWKSEKLWENFKIKKLFGTVELR
jgi:hypothetical protein